MNELMQSILFAGVIMIGLFAPPVVFIWHELKSRSKD